MHHNMLVVANNSTQVTGTDRHFDQLVSVEMYNPTLGLRFPYSCFELHLHSRRAVWKGRKDCLALMLSANLIPFGHLKKQMFKT